MNMISACRWAAVTLIAMIGGGAVNAFARTWSDIESAKEISVCANPNALPYASDRANEPGFQIEIARAVAEKLGVRLKVDWIVPRYRASVYDCDLLMDTIVRPGIHPPSLRLSVPYHRSGVPLAFGANQRPVGRYADLVPGMRIGAMINSVASVVIGKTGAQTVLFGFEDEMLAALGRGEVQAAAVTAASAGYFNLQNGGKALRLVHAEDSEPDLQWSVAIGMRRADAALEERVNAALRELLGNGTLRDIYARYGVEHRAPVTER